MKKKIVITGGTGRFAQSIKKIKIRHRTFFPNKKELDLLSINKIRKYLSKIRPNILIHCAGLSRPMKIHERQISKSIDLNIIGSANITKVCFEKKIKLIYLSTSYVYPGVKGKYKENDPLLPTSNYAWSKLGGESSVQMYKNSLILRMSMTERPFIHKTAFKNVKTSFIYHDEAARILFKLLNKKGIINVGGNAQYIYDFAKKQNKKVKKSFLKKNSIAHIPFDSSMNISLLKRIINKK